MFQDIANLTAPWHRICPLLRFGGYGLVQGSASTERVHPPQRMHIGVSGRVKAKHDIIALVDL